LLGQPQFDFLVALQEDTVSTRINNKKIIFLFKVLIFTVI